MLVKYLKTGLKNNFEQLFTALFFYLVIINVLGNIVRVLTPTLFYRFSVSLALILWIRLIVTSILSFYEELRAHFLPYGAPRIALAILLPLIELLSIIIRPLILRIRISTNLAAGHILLLIIRYFGTLLPGVLTPLVVMTIVLLFILEVAISIIQAYIFVTLLKLYFAEIRESTVPAGVVSLGQKYL